MKSKIIYAAVAALLIFGCSSKKQEVQQIKPLSGNIMVKVSVTGSVMPQNRIQIKPSVAGRIDKVLVNEGDYVKAGQKVAEMSSLERAALLDAAKSGGGEEAAKWEEIYKPIPLIAPLSGNVIVRAIEPGQSVNQSDTVIVLSDRLIIRASVDETDIGKIKKGQETEISLDAYPDVRISGTVNHISYESSSVNNVTTYKVDILPSEIPGFFRSGMSANVDIIVEKKTGVMLLPSEAVSIDEKGASYVNVKGKGKIPEKVYVETGIMENGRTEIISGINYETEVMVSAKSYVAKGKKEEATSPFMPKRPNMRGNKR